MIYNAQYVTILSISGNYCLVSNFTKLHALTQATCSYALLVIINVLVVVLLASFDTFNQNPEINQLCYFDSCTTGQLRNS